MGSSYRPGHRRAASTPVAWRPVVSSPLASSSVIFADSLVEEPTELPCLPPAPCASAPVTPSAPFYSDEAAPAFTSGPSNGFGGELPAATDAPAYSPPPPYTATLVPSAHETIIIPVSHHRRKRSSGSLRSEKRPTPSARTGVTVGAVVAFVGLILSIHLVVALRGDLAEPASLDGAFRLGSEAAEVIAQSVQAFIRACAGLVFLVAGAVPVVLCGRAIDERLSREDDVKVVAPTTSDGQGPSTFGGSVLRLLGIDWGRKGHWKESLCLVEFGTGSFRWQRRRCWVETA